MNSYDEREDIQVLNNYMSSPDIVDPLGPNDAIKHHFTSMKTDLIFLQPWQLGVLELTIPWNWFTNTWQFSSIFHHFKSPSSTTSR